MVGSSLSHHLSTNILLRRTSGILHLLGILV